MRGMSRRSRRRPPARPDRFRRPRVSVGGLARDLGVTPSTIRRDLARLARDGRIVRTYGGAALSVARPLPDVARSAARPRSGRSPTPRPRTSRTATRSPSAAARPTLEFARRLVDRRLTVITNALDVANVLHGPRPASSSSSSAASSGAGMHSTLGHIAELALRELRADALYMGIGAIGPDLAPDERLDARDPHRPGPAPCRARLRRPRGRDEVRARWPRPSCSTSTRSRRWSPTTGVAARRRGRPARPRRRGRDRPVTADDHPARDRRGPGRDPRDRRSRPARRPRHRRPAAARRDPPDPRHRQRDLRTTRAWPRPTLYRRHAAAGRPGRRPDDGRRVPDLPARSSATATRSSASRRPASSSDVVAVAEAWRGRVPVVGIVHVPGSTLTAPGDRGRACRPAARATCRS